MKRRHGLSLLQKRNVKGFMFILPWLIGFIIFYARSMIMKVERDELVEEIVRFYVKHRKL